MKNDFHCKWCQYCQRCGRTKRQRIGTKFERGGRTMFYCEHPDKEVFLGFIGYGGNKYPEDEKVQTIKTHKRWCPRKKETN